MQPTITELGRGRIGLWPKFRTRCQQSSAFNILGPDQWWPPEHAEELTAFIHRLHGRHVIQLQAPRHVVLEHHRRSDGADLLHLVQVDEHVNPIDLVLVGPIFCDRQARIHSLDEPIPRYCVKQEILSLNAARRYTIVELLPREL
jgi:hypothetical protein